MGFSSKNDVADEDGYNKLIDLATRKSIQKTFPMGLVMKSGKNNPVTIHSANSELFRAVYSLITETLSVKIALDRSIKERISRLVSERNKCKVCVTAHTMMETVASNLERKQRGGGDGDSEKARIVEKYTISVLDVLEENRKGGLAEEETSLLADEVTRAEIALVVLLFDHMNRVVSALMGEEMSTAMMGVPRVVARRMEKPNVITIMSQWMSAVLANPFKAKNKPGMTLPLFFGKEGDDVASERVDRLPYHLKGLKLAGSERANAIGRLLEWIDAYEQEQFEKNEFLSKGVVDLLDRAIKAKACDEESNHPGKVLKWATAYDEEELQSELNKLYDSDAGRTIVVLLLLLSLAPLTVYESSQWNATVEKLGGSQNKARCLIIWWSLRMTLRDAAGLKMNNDSLKIDLNEIKHTETEIIDDEPEVEC